MAEATASTVAYANRAVSIMPVGAQPPFMIRLDAGSLPVGYLVFSSGDQDHRRAAGHGDVPVRPMFASLPGMMSPPPFGGNIRTITVNVDPDRLRSYNLSPQDVVDALDRGNYASPSGNVTIKDQTDRRAVEHDGPRPHGAAQHPAEARPERLHPRRGDRGRLDRHPHRLRPGQRRKSVYIPVVKRADASTLTVVSTVKANLARVPGRPARGHQHRLRVRRVPHRPPGHRERRRRGGAGRRADRADGPAVPPRPPERDRRGAEHPAGPPGVDRRPGPDRPHDQHHDPGRPGAGDRHPGRRGDGRDREHPHPDGAHAVDRPARSARATWRRPSPGSWPCSASCRCSSRRSSWRGRSGRSSCRSRWRSGRRWSPRTSSPAPWSRS